MAEDQNDVVIVDGDGTEHVFPSGFDPMKAAAIVRRQYGDAQAAKAQAKAEAGSHFGTQLARSALDALPAIGGMVGGVLSTPETGGVGTIPGMALGAGAGRGLRDLIGHYTGVDAPSTPTQKAENIAGETALAGTTAAVLPGLATAAKAPIQTLRDAADQFGSAMPPAIRRLGNLFPSLPKTQGRILTRPAWQTWETAATDAGATAPSPAMSEADHASLVKRYGPEAAANIEAKLGGSATPAPESPLRQPRIEQGAQRIGQQSGLSKEQVRQQTGPILNENVGEASPILPQNVLGQIIDTMKALPQNQREAYVQRASSGKTMAQVENLRRTLEHLGLLVPIGVGAEVSRRAMLGQMQNQ